MFVRLFNDVAPLPKIIPDIMKWEIRMCSLGDRTQHSALAYATLVQRRSLISNRDVGGRY
jgi:hypothetical protein